VNRDLSEFIHGERNVVRGDLIISRESTATSEYYYVSSPQDKEEFKPILKGWAKKIRPTQKSLPIADIERIPISEALPRPKHTGGKRPYVMIMQDKEFLINQLSINASGALMKLTCGGCVEWGTGKVIDKRSKKPMTVKMICEKLGLKTAEGKIILSELTANKILMYDRKQKAYFVDRDFAKKGDGQNEDKVQKGHDS
jgi:hypothetical protein